MFTNIHWSEYKNEAFIKMDAPFLRSLSLQPKEYTIPDCKIKAYKHTIHVILCRLVQQNMQVFTIKFTK